MLNGEFVRYQSLGTDYSFEVIVNACEGAELIVSIPRDILDSTWEGSDVPFVVTVDGAVVEATESATEPSFRVIRIDLLEGDGQAIEIIGTPPPMEPTAPPGVGIREDLPVAQGEPDAPSRGGGATVIIPEGTGMSGCEETNECYVPHTVMVPVGTTVIWNNTDMVAHTVTAGSVATGPTGEFDSSLLLAGNIFEHTFEETGTYPYYSVVQPWMEGVVVVEEGSAPPAAPPADPASPPASGSTVIIPEGTGVPGCEETNECYLPHTLKVGPGTTVTWENIDAVAHTVTAGSVDTGLTGEFDSSLVLAGGTFEHTFEETGTYPYYSMVQPWMEGVVVVEEGSAPPAAPPADPASPPPSDATIVIPQGPGRACADLNECYVPHRLTVVEGETVTWVNSDVIPHRVTGISGDGVVFGSDRISPGSTFEHTFGIAGEYEIADRDYPWMSGMVIVEELQSLGHTRADDAHDPCLREPLVMVVQSLSHPGGYTGEVHKRAEVRAALCAHKTNVDLCDKSSWPRWTSQLQEIDELLLEYYGDHCVPVHTTCDTHDPRATGVERFPTVCTTKVSIREGGGIMHRHITVPQGVHVSWANTRGDDVFVRVIPVGGGDVLFSSELSREADGLAGGTTDYTFSEPGNYAVVLDIKDRWGRVYEQVSGVVDVRAWGWYEGGHHYKSGVSYGLSDETDN